LSNLIPVIKHLVAITKCLVSIAKSLNLTLPGIRQILLNDLVQFSSYIHFFPAASPLNGRSKFCFL